MPAGRSMEFSGTERFEIRRRLGEGGMGVVYEAFDREQSERVALKTLRRLDPQSLFRLKNEFRALEAIEHPNLVSLGELLEDAGEWFFTMELVDGVDFLEYVRRSEGARVRIAPGDSSSGAVSAHDATMDVSASSDSLIRSTDQIVHSVSPARFDERRLRAALAQLAAGLAEMHAHGKVHRDVKPSNVRVTPEGRVVVLDFGLVAEVVHSMHSEDGSVVGTAAYMAPEQAAARQVGPEADWYAVGVVLYETLTGRLPFTGRPMEIFLDKQRGEPPRPSALIGDLPEDLEALCAELLRFEPDKRPRGHEVLRRLGVADGAALSLSSASQATEAPSFVGRVDELGVLHRAFDDACGGRAVTVVVVADSGVGKSALLREYTDRLSAEREDVVVLRGKCYERESVPYKAFDGVIDALSQYLRQLRKRDAGALLPRFASLLPRVFPVLGRVEVIQQAPRMRDIPDPQELRARAFGALRELLVRMTEQRPVVLTIDDLQWADADSLHLLADLLRPPDEPPVLLLASSRTGWVDVRTVIPRDVRAIDLEPLPADAARELAALLLGKAAVGVAAADSIASEANGHPLYIAELVRHAAISGDDPARAGLRLDEAIWARVQQLPGDALHILELVCVAGARLTRDVIGTAAELQPADLTKLLAMLRVAHLIRGTGGRRGRIEPYHDRVREAVGGHLSDASRRDRHGRLAIALEAAGFARDQPELLVRHLEAAGDAERAAGYAEDAANRARQALAFDRAAELYEVAIRLGARGAAETRALHRQLADALAYAGRGRDAAAAYQRASEGAPAADALELQRRAAEELLRSGHIDDGLAALDRVLGAIGMKLPKTPVRALASLVWRRAQLRLRGLRYAERDDTQIAQERLRRIDICWSTAVGLSMVDPIRGSDFQTRHLLLALRAGEPYRIARALAFEASFAATMGGKARRAHRLAEAADALSARIDNPHARGMAHFGHGTVAHFTGRWQRAQDECESAEEVYRDECTGVAWEIDTVELFQLWSRTQMGGFGEIGERVSRWLGEADKRGNLYMATYLRASFVPYLYLSMDRSADARDMLAGAMDRWSQSGLHVQHLFHTFMSGLVDLYEGAPAEALERYQTWWPKFERAMILRIQTIRALLRYVRATAALGASAGNPRLIRLARRDARRLRGEHMRWIDALAVLLDAQIAHVRGDADRAVAAADAAIALLEENEMLLMATSTRRRKGALIGGDAGDRLVADADAWFAAEGIANGEAMARMMTAGFDAARPARLIEASGARAAPSR